MLKLFRKLFAVDENSFEGIVGDLAKVRSKLHDFSEKMHTLSQNHRDLAKFHEDSAEAALTEKDRAASVRDNLNALLGGAVA